MTSILDRILGRVRRFEGEPVQDFAPAVHRKLLQLEAQMSAALEAEKKIYTIQRTLKRAGIRVPTTLDEVIAARKDLNKWQSTRPPKEAA